MLYTLIHYPQIDTHDIEAFRRKYDPYVNLVKAHMTLVFLTPASVGRETILQHVGSVLERWQPFEIATGGLEKAWDHWLFLLLQRGNQEVIQLHDELYTGPLSPYWRKDIEFIPHISVGLFVKGKYDLKNPQKLAFNDRLYSQALKGAKELNASQTAVFDQLVLAEVDDAFTKMQLVKEFRL